MSAAERALRPMRPLDRLLFVTTKVVVVLMSRLYFRMSVAGRDRLPDGPFILAPIHRSNLDSPFSTNITNRRMRYMGKDTLWGPRWTRRFLFAIGGYPVERGRADRESMRTTIRMIEAGDTVVMFPEGTRCFGPEVNPLFDGPAYVASKTGVPIVPLGIGGSERAMRRGSRFIWPVKLSLVVGTPIPAPVAEPGKRVSRRAVKETTERLARELQIVFDRAQALAGRPNPARPDTETPLASGE